MKGLSGSIPYANDLLSLSDICVLTEHHLYRCELHRLNDICSDVEVCAKSCKLLNDHNVHERFGYGGVAILWRNSLSHCVTLCNDLGDDRLCVVKLQKATGELLYIIAVYLPQQNCYISNFQETVDNLECIIDQCELDGEVIVVGDMNCHFGCDIPVGPRAWGNSTRNAKYLHGIIARKNMYIADLSESCRGPKHTYYVERVGKSYIDHCVVSNALRYRITNCEVLHDDIHNNSDHLPLVIHVDVRDLPTLHHPHQPRVIKHVWHRLKQEDIQAGYTHQLQREVQHVLSQFTYQGDFLDSHCNIEDFISKLVNAMLTVSQRTVPIVRHLRGAKPYWSPQLTQLSRQQRTVRSHWIADGRPRDDHHDTWRQYKAAKREFQRVQRQAEYRYNIEAMEELAESEQIDQRYFWYLISKSRKSASSDSKRLQPTRGVDGTLLYDPDAVNRSWETYYVDLHTPKDLPEYDDVHKAFVTETVSALPHTYLADNESGHAFTLDEVEKKCIKLKLKKAAGWDGIFGEHIRYGGPTLYRALYILFNSITARRMVPEHFKKAVIIPIPKGH